MSFLKAYLTGMKTLVESKSDLERLKHLPQRLEDGELINFNDKSLVGVVDSLAGIEFEVIDAERVKGATRFTSALQKEYFTGFEKLVKLIDGNSPLEEATVETSSEPTIVDRILEVVEAGDKKAFRALRQDIKNAWFACGDDKVSDAIIDLADAVADKDIEFAKEIIESVDATEEATLVNEPEEEPVKELKPTKVEQPTEDSEDDDELLADFNDCIEEGDQEDAELCLKEMKECNHQKLKECEKAYTEKFGTAKTSEEPTDDEEGDVVDEILDDLDDALEKKDLDECKKLIEELKEELESDDEDLVEYVEKVAALDKELNGTTERRARRSRK